jgi:hypothetical protein
MFKAVLCALFVFALHVFPLGAARAENPVQQALKGCSKEIKTYCSLVKPGGGRLVACAKAHEDKLSSQCIYAINRAGFWLDTIVRSLKYVGGQCKADARKYCKGIKLGDGRILTCLNHNKDRLNKFCSTAIRDVDLRVAR